MVQNYMVDKLTLSDLKENGKVRIPSFQRGIVWTKQHRKEFIETVKSGDPFGVVLVSQEGPGEPYYLIDGLQRLSTLKAYMDNPLDLIDENVHFENQDEIDNVFTQKYAALQMAVPGETKLSKEKKSFLKKLLSIMRKYPTTPQPHDIWSEVASHIGVNESEFSVYKAFAGFYQSFIDQNLKLPDIIIHAIVYQGPKERLPYVFETLNTSSVSLTKYEVFSSQWPTGKIVVSDEDLIAKVWSKYDNLKKSSSFEVDVTLDSIRSNGMTLFEFCFGFSELICDENNAYSYLFNKGKKTTDPTGFEVLALACGLPVNKADDIWRPENLGRSSGQFLISLKDALVDSITTVSSALKSWTCDFNGAQIKNTSTYQVYYLITYVFRQMYDLNTREKSIEKKECAKWLGDFKKNANKWYLYQVLTGYWNQHRQVSDLSSAINEKNDVDYSASIPREYWIEALDTYIEANKDSCNGRAIPNDTRLLLNYYYRLMIKEDANRANYFVKSSEDAENIAFDIEHIVPVAKFEAKDEEYPMSSLGNLCYLPVKDNRSKRDKTIYEYAADRPSLTFNKEFLEMIDYPSKEDLAFADSIEKQFKTSYLSLVQRREEKIKERFYDLIVGF